MWGRRVSDDQLKAMRELERDMLLLVDYSGTGVELELLPILRYLPIRSVKMLRQVQERLHGWIAPLNSEAKVCKLSHHQISFIVYLLSSL